MKNKIFESLNDYLNEGVYDKHIFKAFLLAGGPGCFIAGTKVKTELGYKNIEDVKSGEFVYTINEMNGEIELQEVSSLLKYDDHSEDLLELEFENGEIIRCTENHEFYVNGQWVKAKDL